VLVFQGAQHGNFLVLVYCLEHTAWRKILPSVCCACQAGRPSGKVEAMHLDLTSFRSITDFASAFKAKKLPLHTLVNNAGVFLVPHDRTQEGFETTVGTNYFGHFLLTHLLLDNIKDTAKKGGVPTRCAPPAVVPANMSQKSTGRQGTRVNSSVPLLSSV
jgi:NAD(P)-dependent dehydrogenase (short-subunit alcohol dehydrogenase family)